jgi:ABC-2 type transport system permease protein
MANVSPIADLTYRNYDGPLDAPMYRWWVIAKASIRRAVKNKWFWICMVGAGSYYAVMMVVMFVIQQMLLNAGPQAQQGFKTFFGEMNWADQFLHGFSFGQIWYMFIALTLGAGAIANDNRANALLVYLSKPCTKTDYLIGKWVGIYLPMLAAMLIPALVFYGYGVMSFRENGFLSQDPWLIVKILVLMPIGAAFETSLILGVSSLFRQGPIAGASYAALYFITNFFTKLIGMAYMMSQWNGSGPTMGPFRNLFYASIDGVEIGLAKGVLHAGNTLPFGMKQPPGGPQPIAAPNLPITLLIAAVLCALVLWFAWTRIRAVEVVR